MNPLHITIVDDHPIFRKGLKNLLSRYAKFEKITIVECFDELKEICETELVDLIMMDVDLGNVSGIEVTQKIKSLYPNINILAFSGHEEQSFVFKMMGAGASGYILKDSDIDEVLIAIKQVMIGKTYLSSSVSKNLTKLSVFNKKDKSKELEDRLTLRELEILNFIIRDELSNKEIADRLYISPRTVETHKRNLIQKLEVKNTIGLAKFYFEYHDISC